MTKSRLELFGVIFLASVCGAVLAYGYFKLLSKVEDVTPEMKLADSQEHLVMKSASGAELHLFPQMPPIPGCPTEDRPASVTEGPSYLMTGCYHLHHNAVFVILENGEVLVLSLSKFYPFKEDEEEKDAPSRPSPQVLPPGHPQMPGGA